MHALSEDCALWKICAESILESARVEVKLHGGECGTLLGEDLTGNHRLYLCLVKIKLSLCAFFDATKKSFKHLAVIHETNHLIHGEQLLLALIHTLD